MNPPQAALFSENFAPDLSMTLKYTEQSSQAYAYFLFILTDFEISRINFPIVTIVSTTPLPLCFQKHRNKSVQDGY